MSRGSGDGAKKAFDLGEILRRYPLPPYYAHLLRDGRARIYLSGSGVRYCYQPNYGWECFKLFRKIDVSDTTLLMLHILNSKMCTASDLARLLGIPYVDAANLLQYYYKAGLVEREAHLYKMNLRHPQALLFLDRINKRLFYDVKDSKRYSKIVKDLTSSERSEPSSDPNRSTKGSGGEEPPSVERVLERARELAGGLGDAELLIIMRLAEWRRERGRWYACAESPEELREVLNINSIGTAEFTEALRRLERLGLVFRFFDRRHRQHCFRIDRSLARGG